MEKTVERAIPGSRQANMKKSFRRCLDFLLTACPFEEFCEAFPSFTGVEHDQLYQQFVQVIVALHDNLQEEFDTICHETQVGTTLDTVEDLVEQQSLDPLLTKKTNLGHIKHDLLATKQDEIQLLEGLLDKVEERKDNLKARIKLLKKKCEDTSGLGLPETVEKLASTLARYGSYNDDEL